MTADDSNFSFDSLLGKVQALLANADDPALSPEAAESYRNKAEALMFKYRIEEAMLGNRTTSNPLRPEPIWKTFRVAKMGSEWKDNYERICIAALAHIDAQAVRDYEDDYYVLHAVGYESDLRLAEVIFTAGMLAFGTKLEPKYDPAQSDQVNAYVMRSAGWEGWRIARAIWNDDSKANRVKARNLYRKEAAERGESDEGLSGRGVNVAQFRKDYADGFAHEFWSRLWRMRQEHAADERGLVLASRKEKVQEALYARYPNLDPKNRKAGPGWTDPTADCGRCKAAKSGYCRDHGYLRPSKAQPRAASYSAAGAARGRAAARTVDLGAQQKPRAASAERTAIN